MTKSRAIFDNAMASAEIEAMSRDLLLLTRTIGIYPQGHPHLVHMTERLVDWAKLGGDRGITLGVTGTELVVNGEFFGGKDTRAEMLARLLHMRRVARLSLLPYVKPDEIHAMAELLADRSMSGQELRDALDVAAIEGVDLIPLDLGRLHDQLRLEHDPDDLNSEDRRKDIWLWLQGETGSPRDMARALVGEGLWETVLSGEPERVREFADVLTRLGSMVDRAMRLVPEEDRKNIAARFDKVGRSMQAEDLARLVDTYMSDSTGTGETMDALLKHADGDRMAQLLAGLVSLGGQKEERLGAFLKERMDAEAVLGLSGIVAKKKQSGERMGFASEVWEWLDSYLLDYDENAYMGEGYRETLDRMASRLRTEGERSAAFGFFEDVESHLDRVYMYCAGEKMEGARERLDQRVTARLTEEDGVGILDLLCMLDTSVPEALTGRRDVIEELFRVAVPDIKDYPAEVRARLLDFAVRREAEVLDVALRSLQNEERMLVRRFLVEMLCRFSTASLPVIVQKARNNVWYFVRNCAIVLGRMRDHRAFPFLHALLDHEMPQVRREAIRSLAFMGERGKRALTRFIDDPYHLQSEREMARSVIERMSGK